MSDEHKLNSAVSRRAKAENLMRNEMLVEAFLALENAYIQAWRDSPARDTDGRERLWHAVQSVGKLRGHLVSVIADGKLAQREIDELTERRKRSVFGRAA